MEIRDQNIKPNKLSFILIIVMITAFFFYLEYISSIVDLMFFFIYLFTFTQLTYINLLTDHIFQYVKSDLKGATASLADRANALMKLIRDGVAPSLAWAWNVFILLYRTKRYQTVFSLDYIICYFHPKLRWTLILLFKILHEVDVNLVTF